MKTFLLDSANSVLSESTRSRVERGLVGLALGMFMLHLLLYGIKLIFEFN